MPYDYYITPEDYERALKNGVSKSTLERRVYHQLWDKKRAINTPIRKFDKDCKYVKQAKENGIKYGTYWERVNRGWSRQKASTQPVQNLRCEKYHERLRRERRLYPDWVYENMKKHGISQQTFHGRVRSGWSLDE